MKSLLLLSVLFSTLASAGSYRCQLAIRHCGDQGGRHGIILEAKNQEQAEIQCQKAADLQTETMCKVTKQKEDGPRDYRCQTATMFCGKGGGRHGTFFSNPNRKEAEVMCRDYAKFMDETYCKVE